MLQESSIKNQNGNNKRAWLILVAVFLFMLLLNVLMPIHRDDYDYSLIWGTMQHVGSFSDVLQSMWNHYLTHGGRMVTVFGLDLFLWLGKIWFDLANAAIFTGLIALLYFHAMRKVCLGKAPWLLALSAFFAWLALPHFGEVAVWKSGSTVYLWSGICPCAQSQFWKHFRKGKRHTGNSRNTCSGIQHQHNTQAVDAHGQRQHPFSMQGMQMIVCCIHEKTRSSY